MTAASGAGSDGSGTPGEQTTLVKETPYDTKLTVAGPTDLADMTGAVLMTDGTGAPGPYTQTPYKLVTTDIESVVTSSTFFGKTDNTNSNFDDSYAWTTADGTQQEISIPGTITGGAASNHTLHFYTPGTGHVTYVDATGATVYQLFTSNTGIPGSYTKVGAYTITEINDGKAISPFQYSYLTNGALNARGFWGVSGSATTLTFPGDVSTNPDLQYFKPGDVVQENSQFINAAEPEGGTWLRGADQAFDGLYTSYGANAGGGNYVFWEPGTMSGNFVFWRYKAQPDSLITVYYNDGSTQDYAFDVSDVVTSPDNVTDCVKCDIGFQEDVAKFGVRHDGGQGADWVAVQLDGQTLVDTGDPDFTVISTGYPDSNTMVVDGGEWSSSDDIGWRKELVRTHYI